MTRFLTVLALAVIATALLPISAHAVTTVTVPGTQQWTDTLISVNAGHKISIQASGTIYIAGSDPGKGPEGAPGCVTDSTWPIAGVTCWSLIGRIGNGTPFNVGKSTTVTAQSDGELFLGVADNVFGDNWGAWTAVIDVTAAPRLSYVALGDSYSSGDGGGTYQNQACKLSANSFPVMLQARHPDLRLPTAVNYACTGATTVPTTVPTFQVPANVDPDQINKLKTANATNPVNLVTITVGGDDLGFSGVLKLCYGAVLGAHLLAAAGDPKHPLTQGQQDAISSAACNAQDRLVQSKLAALPAKLLKVYQDIHSAAPQARILVVGYPDIFPTQPTGSCNLLPLASVKWMNDKGLALNETVSASVLAAKRAMNSNALEYVDSWVVFQGHTACSSEPWVNPVDVVSFFSLPSPLQVTGWFASFERTPLHPGPEGYDAWATHVHDYLIAHPNP